MWIFCLCKYKQQRLLLHDFILIFLTDSAIKSVYIEHLTITFHYFVNKITNNEPVL